MADILKILFGITWFILACLFTAKTWYIVPILDDIILDITNEPLLRIIYWVGLLITWTLAAAAVPIYTIMDGFKETEQEI